MGKSARAAFLLTFVAALFAGCAVRSPAPVTDRTPAQARTAPPATPVPRAPEAARPDTYIVKPGDTLYSIALDHGLDYRELAAWNNLENVGVIRVGQQLRLTAPPGTAVAAPLKAPAGVVESRPLDSKGLPPPAAVVPVPPPGAAAPAPGIGQKLKTQPKALRMPYSDQAWAQLTRPEAPPAAPAAEAKAEAKTQDKADVPRAAGGRDWIWPTAGKVVASFNGNTSKGIDIAGKAGQSVVAAAPGRVIFSGTGIRGLGKFVVIKHSNDFISVYGHNNEVLVKQDQVVAKGQKIAEMGNTDADKVQLHFEIRHFGNPVDPLTLLPDRG